MKNKKIEKEAKKLVKLLTHPAGFNVDFGGILCIRPTDESSPPVTWEVDWDDWDGNKCHQNFDNLYDAAYFFAEKRFHLGYGLDYERQIKYEQ
jgi:hypothetical protein